MSQVEYTEYDPQFAKAVADMWNRSSEGWNGRVWNSSEARVLQEERDSSHLNLWLALSGKEVVGYAKLTPYSMEDGVAYVELISVDPAWHGRGIGKGLMQKCVLRSAELGYKRLDLFTWPGNTKAVPLYKKCGFFWERMEAQATHLMNFLPGILNSGYFRPYFDFFHWYEDLERDLSISPDGREANGFEYYDYRWNKDGRTLLVTFEKTGRGITGFATDEFAVEVVVGQSQPVFGTEQKVLYKFTNRSGKPLAVRLEGRDDGNVKYSAQYQVELTDQAAWEASYRLEEPPPDSGEWGTLTGVLTLLTLGEQVLELKTGLKTQYPLSFSLIGDNSIIMPGREYQLYLNAQNRFDSACEFELEFLPQEPVRLAESRHRITLAAQARANIPLWITASGGCIWTPLLRITARPDQERELTFEKRGEIMLRAFEGRDQKTLERSHALINGLHALTVNTKQGKNSASFSGAFSDYCNILGPMPGEPFSEEFERIDAHEARFEELQGANQLTLCYRSQDFPGAEFAIIFRLHPSGLLEYWLRIIRLPQNGSDLSVRLGVIPNSSFISYEQEGELRTLERDQIEADLDWLPEGCVTGNFIFSGRDGITTAYVWDPALKVKIMDWYLAWDLNLSAMLQAGELESKPIRVFLNQFQNALQTRDYARGCYLPYAAAHPTLELRANCGNPILTGPFSAELLWRQDRDLVGSFSLSLNGRDLKDKKVLEKASQQRGVNWDVTEFPTEPMIELGSDSALPLYHLHRTQILFQPCGSMHSSCEGNWLRVDNGVLRLSAAMDSTLPVLISLEQQGLEWLDQAYPDYQAKSHYNPYPGGLHVRPDKISLAELRKEKHSLGVARVRDQHGNIWEGLVFATTIGNYKPCKGLSFRQYYLTLPGLPLLAITTQVVSGTGFASFERLPLMGFFAPGGKLERCQMQIPVSEGRWQSLDAGKEAVRIWEAIHHLIVKDAGTGRSLQLLSEGKTQTVLHIDKTVARFRVERYSPRLCEYPKWIQPSFMVFSQERLDWESFGQLLGTRFMAEL